MDAHQVEPVLLLHARPEELDFAITKRAKQSFVPHIAHAVQRELRATLLQQHRLDENIVRLRCPTIVVDKT